ncbi:MAG: hypothetical protein AB7E95_10110 [Kiritimatiellales bacterium]
MEGIIWMCNQGLVQDCGSFQDSDTGEVKAWAKLAYFGGLASLTISPEDLKKIAPFKGKMVSCSGRLEHEIKKGSGKESTRFCVDEVKAISK